jgi:hypothetical protein
MSGRLYFNSSTPFDLKSGQFRLPAGKYILYQMIPHDPTLFALYQEDQARPPVAMIRAQLIDYGPYISPQKTQIILAVDETARPAMTGWTVRGHDEWRIISVVEEKGSWIIGRSK